jgi:AAA+ ATPase superfamily predicted ATPase
MNPFIIKGYYGPEFFCNREKELQSMLASLENKRNVTLVALTGMGKTALIHHLLGTLVRNKPCDQLYLDIGVTGNANAFINKLGSALFRSQKTFDDKMRDFVQLRRVRPVISSDPVTGNTTIRFNVNSWEDIRITLEDLFFIIEKKNRQKPLFVAIDEFQQIRNYPEQNVKVLVAELIQKVKDVRFIFTERKKSSIYKQFTDVNRSIDPLSDVIAMDEIPANDYKAFIRNMFLSGQKEISDETCDQLMSWCRLHTGCVQEVCHRLYLREAAVIDDTLIREAEDGILDEREPYYLSYRNLLTQHQWQLMKALGKENGVVNITSSSFIRQYGLTNHSTVRRGIESLLEKEMIVCQEGKYLIYDPFFSRWLEAQE